MGSSKITNRFWESEHYLESPWVVCLETVQLVLVCILSIAKALNFPVGLLTICIVDDAPKKTRGFLSGAFQQGYALYVSSFKSFF